jgi:hypothetical protein
MNDMELGKKIEEKLDLEHFIEAYEYVTGERLEIVEQRESPDFICERPDGNLIGIEITSVMREPNDYFYETVILKKEFIRPYNLISMAYSAAERKSKKKQRNKWALKNNTILILQLYEFPSSELEDHIDESVCVDFSTLGFSEIWLADYTEFDAYGDIELFGLHPENWYGHHERQNAYKKPYG